MMTGLLAPLRDFIIRFSRLLDDEKDEKGILSLGSEFLRDLIANDAWLPDEYAAPSGESYRQYLLHCDSSERFSVVSFVWGPGQFTPVHDHRVWGLVGMLRGEELSEPWRKQADGQIVPAGDPRLLRVGDVETISPALGDIHRVSNALGEQTSISIHVYGANIGRLERSAFDDSGRARPFVSGYSNHSIPNVWSA